MPPQNDTKKRPEIMREHVGWTAPPPLAISTRSRGICWPVFLCRELATIQYKFIRPVLIMGLREHRCLMPPSFWKTFLIWLAIPLSESYKPQLLETTPVKACSCPGHPSMPLPCQAASVGISLLTCSTGSSDSVHVVLSSLTRPYPQFHPTSIRNGASKFEGAS